MQLRFLLIATILAGLGAITVSQLLVRPQINRIAAARDQNFEQYQSEQRVHNNTKGTLKAAQAKLQETESNLLTARDQLMLANTKAAEQQQFANRLQTDLNQTGKELAAAKADLAAWTSLSITVDQVSGVLAEVKKLRATNEAIVEERDLLASLLKKAAADRFGDSSLSIEPLLPAGLKGKVLVVDPKYDFVVLDIGSDNGVEPRGVLLVARHSELVGKVRVATVQSQRSIANIVPGWKLREIKEGDLVLY